MLSMDSSFQPSVVTISIPDHPVSNEDTIKAPLITTLGPPEAVKESSVRLTTINLINTFVGSGLMSLPHAFAGLGIYAGLLVVCFVTVIMHVGQFKLISVVDVSESGSLSQIAKERFGTRMGRLIFLCILLNNFGVLILYLVVLGDILVGTSGDGYDGLLSNLLSDHSGEMWYLSRAVVTLMLCIFVIQPLVLKRRLDALGGVSVVAVTLVSLFGAFCVFLAARAFPNTNLTAMPNLAIREDDIDRNCGLNLILQGISVYVFAFIGHYNIPPMMKEIEYDAKDHMNSALHRGVGVVSLLYTIVPISCVIVFGKETNGDVLENFGVHSLAKAMPENIANIMSAVIEFGYTLILLCIFPMDHFALRQTCSTLIFDTHRPTGWRFYAVTYFLLFAIYISALSIRSVFTIVSFVGCTACAIMGLILPGLLLRQDGCLRAWMMLLLGVLLIFHGTIGEAWRWMNGRPIYCEF